VTFFILFALTLWACPFSYASEVDISGIEEKLLVRDIKGAQNILNKSRWNAPLHDEAELTINCIKNTLIFYTYLNQNKDVKSAISAYVPMIGSCNELPQESSFSQKFVTALNSAIDGADKFIAKECGNDYDKIRIGMKLDRVQKCVAEYFLRGQVKTKNGVVDHYARGDSWMYVKKGKVVAWGD